MASSTLSVERGQRDSALPKESTLIANANGLMRTRLKLMLRLMLMLMLKANATC